ncbi:MAG: CDP-archaeol synthase [Oscillatoria sp. SIO1A7]|nr:CDP-archaeol synthase [Oscillatoria sp. SIO1A7]
MNLLPFFQTFFQDSYNILWLLCALFIAGVLEAFLWKTPLFEPFNKPINVQLFGANKKWRGLISLPLTHAASVFCLQLVERVLLPVLLPEFACDRGGLILFSCFNFLEYGLLVGFIFNLSELPNSFIKRRLNIPPGDESNPVFFFIDHMDSTYGTLILWYFYFKFPFHIIAVGLLVAPLLFMLATWIRKRLGLKK